MPYWIEVQEYIGTSVAAGSYAGSNGAHHTPSEFISMLQYSNEYPTKLAAWDRVRPPNLSPPFSIGETFFPISWRFKVPSGLTKEPKVFTVVDHIATCTDTGEVSTGKGGYNVTREAADPEVIPPCILDDE